MRPKNNIMGHYLIQNHKSINLSQQYYLNYSCLAISLKSFKEVLKIKNSFKIQIEILCFSVR